MHPHPGAPLLSVEGLGKAFHMHGLSRTLPAFDGVSFVVRPGALIRVDGPNGAGKSTLLRVLYRTYRAQRGRAIYRSHHGPVDLVRAADVDIHALRRSEIGFVTQFLDVRPRMSAQDAVAEALPLAAHEPARALEAAHEALDALGLKRELWSADPRAFSGGEQQKVNLARALLRPCRLLLLDEPTASLDRGARCALIDRLAALKAQGTAMIGVFHVAEEVAELVDDTVTLAATPSPAQPADAHVAV